MPFCPSCGSEFRTGFSECNSCHVPLVATLNGAAIAAAEPVDADSEESAEGVLQLLITIASNSQAAFIRRLLDEAGVPSVLLGGHGDEVRTGEPYRIYVDEDYFDAARETIESFRAPSLLTGQIEGDLSRLSQEMGRLEKDHAHLRPQLHAVKTSMEKLQDDLDKLNRELE